MSLTQRLGKITVFGRALNITAKVEMEIKRCFEILELDPNASIEEVKVAYKDIVNVWHPDRFAHNSRLKEKAEQKLKEINIAYETITSFLSLKKGHGSISGQAPQTKTVAREKAEAKEKAGPEEAYPDAHEEAQPRDKTEAAAEAGTRIFLEVCSFLYTGLRRIIDKQVFNAETRDEARSKGINRNQQ